MENWKQYVQKYIRKENGKYVWSDGTPAPVRDMLLSYLAPNFRVSQNRNVEITIGWENHVSDSDVIKAIYGLIRKYGKHANVFIEPGTVLSKHPFKGSLEFGEGGYLYLTTDININGDKVGQLETDLENPPKPTHGKNGWIVPLDKWDQVMSHVVGVEWLMEDEDKIKNKVLSLMKVD